MNREVETLIQEFATRMYELTLHVPDRIDVPFAVFDRLVTGAGMRASPSWEVQYETGHGRMRIVCSSGPASPQPGSDTEKR